MTRFERIKIMTIDEVAKELDKIDVTGEICREVKKCPYMDEDGNMSGDCDCSGCIKKWLMGECEG